MKSYPVVRSLSRLAAGVCLVACSNNGALFDEDPVSGEPGGEPPVGPLDPIRNESPPAQPVPSGDPEPTSPGEELPDDDDLPLGGSQDLPNGVEREPPAEPAGPVIVSVSPPDGAVGVDGAVNIVIAFSEPMDRDATEAAYQSESVPSGSVSFTWNEDGTELTIVPDAPLAYPVGPEPALVPARRVSFFISASAADVEGRRLAAPHESSFSLLRQVEFALRAVRDRDLSGNFRSNDTYGAGQCTRAQVNMCVGDVRVGGGNEQYRGFISFELPELPDDAQQVSAQLRLEITGMSGNPFGGLGGLVLEHASFEVIGAAAFSADALDELGPIADAGGTGTIVSADVASALVADARERALSQYRLRFEDETDNDTTSDAILSAWDTQTIDVSYLVP